MVHDKGERNTKIIEFINPGTYHMKKGYDNQDAVYHSCNDRYKVISLCDGVSSCDKAKKGAELACCAITKLFIGKSTFFLEYQKGQAKELILSHILYELQKAADEDSADVNDYSSTVSSVLVDTKKKRMLCFQLGDGMILGVSKGKCHILSSPPPENSAGCCVTTTIGAAAQATVKWVDDISLDSVVICSDGAWKKMMEDGELKPEVSLFLIRQEYDKFASFLKAQNCFDDHSFIALDMRKTARRESA